MSGHNVALWCEALFASDLQASQEPDPQQVRAAVRETLRLFGARQCVARVAQEFGDHPDMAVLRMRWAREAVSCAHRSTSQTQAARAPSV
jgi:hypothetical protein